MPMCRFRRLVIFARVFFVAPAASVATPVWAQPAGTGMVIVTITGLRSEKGQVKIAMFSSAETWLGDSTKYNTTIDVDAPAVSWKINDVPYGDYGIAVFHDQNKNGKDKNFLGMPQEAYGFSNNLRVVLGPPKWDKSKFAVKGATTEVAIAVK